MRIIRFEDEQGVVRHGRDLGDGSAEPLVGELFGEHHFAGDPVAVKRLLAPLVPSQILGVGCNYRELAEKTGVSVPEYPVTFFKLPNAVQDPGGPIVIPKALPVEKVDWEAELAVVIGRECKNVGKAEALDCVFGYTGANDVSAKDWQKERVGGQWCKGKGYDTFCPLGPAIVTADEIADPNELAVRCTVNGEVKQDSNTADMIFDVAAILEFLSAGHTLTPGTVILTGTPYGVAGNHDPVRFLQDGDEVVVEVEGIGKLANPVVAEA